MKVSLVGSVVGRPGQCADAVRGLRGWRLSLQQVVIVLSAVFAPAVLAQSGPALPVSLSLGGGLSEVSGVVPLGIAPPAGVLLGGPDASLAAFRLEITLPGDLAAALEASGSEITIAVESERVAGATTEQTVAPMPRSHLRRTLRDGSPEPRAVTAFSLRRAVPDDPALRRQSGYNKFISPWIVAIADPRASEQYKWPEGTTAQQKSALGCEACERPAFLAGKTEADGVYELYTNGRIIAVRPECLPAPLKSSSSLSEPRASSLEPRAPCSTIFAATPYAYLGESGRLVNRFATVMADTVRPTDVLVAGQNPPVAAGMIAETIYLHSGEVETANLDLDADGRAGWNVLVDRTYRSRTVGMSAIGKGWESSLFRRLRPLPSGGVEYRDGEGEVWRFVSKATGYQSPAGLFLTLSRSDHGWILVDQKWRTTTFDELGRITAESDEFVVATSPFTTGNVIRYLYDSEGRLGQIIDPVGRISTVEYWPDVPSGSAGEFPGAVRSITDWRDRTVSYEYSPAGLLTKVSLAEVPNSDGIRPAIQYGYNGSSTTYNDAIEIASNLTAVRDPSGPADRLTFDYETSPALRDRVKTERWGTGETTSIEYLSSAKVATTDALGQRRETDLTPQPQDYTSDRSHIRSLVEKRVTVSATPFGTLPSAAIAGTPAVAETDRTVTFSFQPQGVLAESIFEGIRKRTYSYLTPAGAPGLIPESTTTTAIGGTTTTPITRRFLYRTEANLTTFLSAVQANGIEIQSPETGRSSASVAPLVAMNDSVTSTTSFAPDGQVAEFQSSGGTDSGGAGVHTSTSYFPETALPWERGLPQSINDGGLVTTFAYPDRDTLVVTDPRGVIYRTEFDSWRRPRHGTITSPFELAIDERYQYDATGRLKQSTRQQGTALVSTDYAYDVMNRRVAVRTNNIAVGGSLATLETRTSYDLPGRKITTTLPGGAVVTNDLDPLGRVAHRITATGSSPIEERFAYDLDDNPVFYTDMKVATAAAFDVHGREVATLLPDATKTTRQYDAWSRPTVSERVDTSGLTAAHLEMSYTAAGRLEDLRLSVDSDLMTEVRLAWDGGGRTTGISRGGRATGVTKSSLGSAVTTGPDRAMHSVFDTAGRMTSASAGAGSATATVEEFDRQEVAGFSGYLPTASKHSERSGAAYDEAAQYNTLGDAVRTRIGPLEFEQHSDQSGNLTAAQTPNRPSSSYEHDARGAMTRAQLPDGAENKFQYAASGALKQFLDPSTEATDTTTDLIGRPLQKTYADGTNETIEWDGPRVGAMTDRQGRQQRYVYNTRGQIITITAADGTPYDVLDYDESGRLTRWTNKDAAITWEDFDLAGHPRRTTQTRYKDSSGLGSRSVLDSYVQQHAWNAHDERTRTTLPSYASFAPTGGWTAALNFSYDAMGNLVAIDRQSSGSDPAKPLFSASYRNAGRPDQRTVSTGCGTSAGCTSASIVRTYGYDSASGQLNGMRVAIGPRTVAGSAIRYDGLQVAGETLLGVSDEKRSNEYSYDARSRLATAAIARDSVLKTTETLTPADFRKASARPAHFDPPARAALLSAGVKVNAIDPRPLTANEQPGHKIAEVTEEATRSFTWTGAERTGDGRFSYSFDEKGRLVTALERITVPPQPILLRERFYYDGNDRLVGRKAEEAILAGGAEPKESDWTLAGQELLSDGMPAEVSFVWDAVSDQLVEVFKAGASTNPAIDANGGLLRQIIHGGLQYDDPIEVTEVDSSSLSPQPSHIYPIYDEAGAATLQAVLGESGNLLSRHVLSDPYGAEESSLAGAAVDRVDVNAAKDNSGTLASVEIRIRLTEQIAAASLAAGVRLAAVDATGTVVRSTAAAPQLFDNYTVGWTLTPAQWEALTSTTSATSTSATSTTSLEPRASSLAPVFLSIAATNTLRSEAFGPTATILPAPEWATVTHPVYSSTALPIEVREQLATLSSWLSSIPNGATNTDTLYEIQDLALAGTPGQSSASRLLVMSSFQAYPFADPVTGLVYGRARWLDLSTGTWLSPDPLRYRDSSNLYAFCGGDPVNCRDPRGEGILDEALNWLANTRPVRVMAAGADVIDRAAEDVGKLIDLTLQNWLGSKTPFDPDVSELIEAAGGPVGPGLGLQLGMVVQDRLARDTGQIGGKGAELATREGVYYIAAGVIAKTPRLVRELLPDTKAERELLTGGRLAEQSVEEIRATRIAPGVWVKRTESMSAEAKAYEMGVAGGRGGEAYRVPFENPNPRGRPYVHFDGVTATGMPIDAKLSIVTRSKTVGQAVRQAEALRQAAVRGVWKVPDMGEAVRARFMLRAAGAEDVIYIVVEVP